MAREQSMKKRNKKKKKLVKTTFHVSFQRTQVGGKEATRLKQEKKRKTNLQIKPSEKELRWVQIMLKRIVTETIIKSILNKPKKISKTHVQTMLAVIKCAHQNLKQQKKKTIGIENEGEEENIQQTHLRSPLSNKTFLSFTPLPSQYRFLPLKQATLQKISSLSKLLLKKKIPPSTLVSSSKNSLSQANLSCKPLPTPLCIPQ